MAKSTYGTILEYRDDSSKEYSFLCDIKNTPAFMPEVNRVETTTLSDATETNVLGIGRFSDFDFTLNVEDDKTLVGWTFEDVLALEKNKVYQFRVESFKGFKKSVDETGKATFEGTPFFSVTWSGEVVVGLNESEVDGINEATISISTSSTPIIKMGQPTTDANSKDVTLGTKPKA
jgi:hypothetical protein